MKTSFNHLFWTNRVLTEEGSLTRIRNVEPYFGYDKVSAPPAYGTMSGVDSARIGYSIVHKSETIDFERLIDELYRRMQDGREALVYVHGYSHYFNKLIGNIEMFHSFYVEPEHSTIGHLLPFGWASAGNFWQYFYDRELALKSARQLLQFARDLHRYPAHLTDEERAAFRKRINISAGSMGNLVFEEFAALWEKEGDIKETFNEVIHLGSDVRGDVYNRGGRMTALTKIGRRVHVYFSDRDNLLHRSRFVNKCDRLGLSGWTRDSIEADNLYFVDVLDPTVYAYQDRRYRWQLMERTYSSLHNYMERVPEVWDDVISICRHDDAASIIARARDTTKAPTVFKLASRPDIGLDVDFGKYKCY